MVGDVWEDRRGYPGHYRYQVYRLLRRSGAVTMTWTIDLPEGIERDPGRAWRHFRRIMVYGPG